jgi:RNA polymerase sigma factor (sigma-70 family)
MLTTERQELAERYLPFANSLARRYGEKFPHLAEELAGEAQLALCQASESFDEARGVRFATFAAWRINGALCDELRRQTPKGYRHAPDDAPSIETLDQVDVIDPAPPAEEAVERLDLVDDVLAELPERHEVICRLAFMAGLSQARVAEAVGASKTAVQRAAKEARALLAAYPNPMETR